MTTGQGPDGIHVSLNNDAADAEALIGLVFEWPQFTVDNSRSQDPKAIPASGKPQVDISRT